MMNTNKQIQDLSLALIIIYVLPTETLYKVTGVIITR